MKKVLHIACLIFALMFAWGGRNHIWWIALLIGYTATMYSCHEKLAHYKNNPLVKKIITNDFAHHIKYILHGMFVAFAYGAEINKVGMDIGLSAKDFPATVALLIVPMTIAIYAGLGLLLLTLIALLSATYNLSKCATSLIKGCTPTKCTLLNIGAAVNTTIFVALGFGFHAKFIATTFGNDKLTLKIAYEFDYQWMHKFPGVSPQKIGTGKVCLHGDDYYSIMTPDLKIKFEKIVSIEEIKSKGYIE